jgi:hypothetical protein
MSIEEAKEELIIQTIILESLIPETFEGAQEERDEAERMIAKLKALIKEGEGRGEVPQDRQGTVSFCLYGSLA